MIELDVGQVIVFGSMLFTVGFVVGVMIDSAVDKMYGLKDSIWGRSRRRHNV